METYREFLDGALSINTGLYAPRMGVGFGVAHHRHPGSSFVKLTLGTAWITVTWTRQPIGCHFAERIDDIGVAA